MKTTLQYLDAVKAKHGLTSDYQLAKALGLRQSAISGYRAGRSHPDDTIALRIAELLGINAMEIISAANVERAKTKETRGIWTDAWNRFAVNFESLRKHSGLRLSPALA